MPIKVPDNLPAIEFLSQEGVDVISTNAAQRQDIRPLRLLLLNLMPKKKETEIQFARLLGNSPLQLDLMLLTTASYKPRNIEPAHLRRFYRELDDIRNEYFDALIITGAPVETLCFEKVQYWQELEEILDWSKAHCFRRLGICWGAQALMKHFHCIEKLLMQEKLFGVFEHQLSPSKGRLLQGFTEKFPMPVSRYTCNDPNEIAGANLEILASSEDAGVGMVRCPSTGDLYVLNHLEYDASTLDDEYRRDLANGVRINFPLNYFPNNDPSKQPINRWRPFAYLLITNWINELYRDTPFELSSFSKR